MNGIELAKAHYGKSIENIFCSCGALMVLRQNSKNSNVFLGCSAFNSHKPGSCDKTLDIEQYLGGVTVKPESTSESEYVITVHDDVPLPAKRSRRGLAPKYDSAIDSLKVGQMFLIEEPDSEKRKKLAKSIGNAANNFKQKRKDGRNFTVSATEIPNAVGCWRTL